jgi:hypothetical protein
MTECEYRLAISWPYVRAVEDSQQFSNIFTAFDPLSIDKVPLTVAKSSMRIAKSAGATHPCDNSRTVSQVPETDTSICRSLQVASFVVPVPGKGLESRRGTAAEQGTGFEMDSVPEWDIGLERGIVPGVEIGVGLRPVPVVLGLRRTILAP